MEIEPPKVHHGSCPHIFRKPDLLSAAKFAQEYGIVGDEGHVLRGCYHVRWVRGGFPGELLSFIFKRDSWFRALEGGRMHAEEALTHLFLDNVGRDCRGVLLKVAAPKRVQIPASKSPSFELRVIFRKVFHRGILRGIGYYRLYVETTYLITASVSNNIRDRPALDTV